MVRAILEGRKTETRRPVTEKHLFKLGIDPENAEPRLLRDLPQTPFGRPGHRLWVKEQWAEQEESPSILYRADVEHADGIKWKPAMFMPKWASRITLRITSISVQYLQDITEREAKKEGFSSRMEFAKAWDEIYQKKGFGWGRNPLVWIIRFRII